MWVSSYINWLRAMNSWIIALFQITNKRLCISYPKGALKCLFASCNWCVCRCSLSFFLYSYIQIRTYVEISHHTGLQCIVFRGVIPTPPKCYFDEEYYWETTKLFLPWNIRVIWFKNSKKIYIVPTLINDMKWTYIKQNLWPLDHIWMQLAHILIKHTQLR